MILQGSFSYDGDTEPWLLLSLSCMPLCFAMMRGWSMMKMTAGRLRGTRPRGRFLFSVVRAGMDERELRRRYPRLDELPFSPELRRMVTLQRFEGRMRLFMKGAPESVLAACSVVLLTDGPATLDAPMRRKLLVVADGFARRAMRVLAFAEGWDKGDRRERFGNDFFSGLPQ